MKCAHIEEHTVDYLAGHLEPAQRREFDAHLADCTACREALQALDALWARLEALPEVQPSSGLRSRVDAVIDAYRQGMQDSFKPATSSRLAWDDFLAWFRLRPALPVAVVLLVFAAGALVGPRIARSGPRDEGVAQLRDEVAHLRQLTALTLLQQPSASERLQGVNWTRRLEAQDDKVLSALLQALATDPNVNVRVAAVEVLGTFAGESTIRQGLLASLARETAPLVQIELIDLMVGLREKACIPVLEQIVQNPEQNLAVRQRAEWGLQRLI
jgi:hypothetical protein